MANGIPLIREITPKFMPLNAPTIHGAGPVKQSATAFQLKPMTPADLVVGAKAAPTDEHTQLTAQAQKLVAEAFYAPMLKQMHDNPFKASWVDGGKGGKAFEPLMDEKIVDHLSKTSGRKLTSSIVKKMEHGRAGKAYRKGDMKGNQNTASMLGKMLTSHSGNHVTAGLRA